MKRKSTAKTDAEFSKEFEEKRPDLEKLSFYVNSKTKIKVRCKDCKHEWWAAPNNLLYKKSGCPKCHFNKMAQARLTPLDVMLKRLDERWAGLIEYVGGFVKMAVKCLWRCTIDGTVWSARPNDIINKMEGCPSCATRHKAEKLTKPLEEVIKIVRNVWGDSVLYNSGYVNTHVKCAWFCSKCGCVFYATPRHVMDGHGCRKCGIELKSKNAILSLEIVIERVEEKHNHKIEYVKEYINCSTPCLWRCRDCGHEWWANPSDIFRGRGCSICVKHSLEKPILEALHKKGILPVHDKALDGSNYKGSSRPLRVDFIIETCDGKLAVEADGEQHFHSVYGEDTLKFQQEKDRHKDKILKERGYILIRVTSSPTKEWGTEKHITLAELLHLIEIGIDEYGNVNLDVFRPYDFNRE